MVLGERLAALDGAAICQVRREDDGSPRGAAWSSCLIAEMLIAALGTVTFCARPLLISAILARNLRGVSENLIKQSTRGQKP